MVHKRRHSEAVDPKQEGSEVDEKERMNAFLMDACISTLRDHAPRGMTTKELMAALEEQHGSQLASMTSSILSTKLNAMFRKFHSDSSSPSKKQLQQLPLVRETSKDLPRRLVYTFAGEQESDHDQEKEKEQDYSIKQKSEASLSSKNKTKQVDALATPPAEAEHSVSDVEELELSPKRRKLEVSPSVSQENALGTAPATPVSESSRSQSVDSLASASSSTNAVAADAAASLKSLEAMQMPPMPASLTASMAAHQKALAARGLRTQLPNPTNPQKFNLYYDNLGVDGLAGAMSPALTECQSPKWDLDLTSEYVPPDALDVDELESFVC